MVVITVSPHPSPAGPTGPTRTFGVEEELLLVDARTLEPAAVSPGVVRDHGGSPAPSGHRICTELQQEQIEVACPPVTGLADQLAAVRRGRALLDAAARRAGARVVALASPVFPARPHLVPQPRYAWLRERFGLVAAEQLTCGLHVHVGVAGPDEGVAVLDRIRGWLPVLLALSANSPFWYGQDTGFASYRYQTWTRWPTAGPDELLGTAQEYDRRCEALLRSGVALDRGMLYFDARLSARYPTVEIRVADVCLEAEHAAVLAALVRALVETAARQWQAGAAAPRIGVGQLRAWSWQAGAAGVEGALISPGSGAPAPAAEVVAQLLDLVRPVLAQWGEAGQVEAVVAGILRDGSGARRQRAAFAARQDPRDVVRAALEATHR
ncbi:carboxylate--amine ligase [Kocuria rosea subsp. polaris]|uniref:Putative glutamate--cysteine ligase 2 n=1 Tax=Kocuria rosea subsp. polaris TaxID=136273 RepID=A0A0W8I7V7_KOCRO|nr:carboxylate--amine ligase [Kocuria polaris]